MQAVIDTQTPLYACASQLDLSTGGNGSFWTVVSTGLPRLPHPNAQSSFRNPTAFWRKNEVAEDPPIEVKLLMQLVAERLHLNRSALQLPPLPAYEMEYFILEVGVAL